ncbi:hypothetical protein KKE19_04365 [Patescibacteria group bacterium]|nr:hypothetical protein [Patescibacteria group bacterium]MBU4275015.1 hypothetical protein [Patescibacteria group bacterium]MBU4367288.1 hypothetical protein [Patescibacteria group bacterium]MBU4461995.1 hypothetical protein [Patescibacteria group bacterium]MCG2700186.1 DUF5654 family protein [Candidatus Parcubacteria bacterium]
MNVIKQKINRLKDEEKKLRKEVGEKTMSYIVAAFGLVAGLAWNDAIKSLIEYLFPLQKNNLLIKFVYAVLMTFVVVSISIYLIRLIKKEGQTH